MALRDMLDPMLRRALAAGEERMGRAVGRLLASERVTTGLQTLVTSAVQAKHTFDRGVEQALHAANLPSREDVASLRQKLTELESMIDGLAQKVEGAPEPAADDAGDEA